ncbi:FAD-binding oxidoreductase [Arthrobacter gengyunqii]|uniref:FAD-binding oxidoreductase n=1 Tax=Arthrobacter gengyunqii TaxID=2886940 RepID=A0A9X1M1N8_9MICC|nr:FAD-binding oxidoreductase [Arthrobacter gengyunqii]MCC3268759.1 FAD-binding oxidoreductase [Arthrobacter gengyunqii]UOY96143.1 FAD-binding oxidoreductase [Arthrobacter gengyunqii]
MDSRSAFLDRAAEIVGAENVIRPNAEAGYIDPYPLNAGRGKWPGVMPGCVEEVQELVRLAGELEVPLWTFSRGKNLGYGGPEPRGTEMVALDLSRMNRILEVNDELNYAVVEPGVTFFDLFEHIKAKGLKLWMSVPALGWGSVLGNMLDRGYGMTPMGDHVKSLCGMEVVLPDGELLRTGMWAMEGTDLGPLFQGGFGPTLDGLFTQSNLGVATKVGLWLMPWPDVYINGDVVVEREEDMPKLVDILTQLRREDIIQNNALCGNVVRAATMNGPRSRWYTGEGSIPDERLEEMRHEMGVGQWNAKFAIYGDKGLAERRLEIIRERFAGLEGFTVKARTYEGSDGAQVAYEDIAPMDRTQMAGVPTLKPLSTVAWAAENGGHIDAAPILPARGQDVWDFYQEAKALYREYGFDLYIGYHLYPRHMVHVTMIFFENGNEEMLARARELYAKLLQAARRRGYAPYRSHVDYMDTIADGFDFNNNALRRFQEVLKDAVDPKGILSPGKQGVWPAKFRPAVDGAAVRS